MDSGKDFHWKFEVVKGFFAQDDPNTDPESFNITENDFGLIPRSYDTDLVHEEPATSQWQRFANNLSNMNREARGTATTYKVLFLARHGQGDHNVAEKYYGTRAWDCFYSLLPGNGTVTWLDAHLTPLGVSQAETMSAFWRGQISKQQMPTPQFFVSSPLTRAIRTAQLTFEPLRKDGLLKGGDLKLHIMENLRECIGIHTCDQRSTRSHIEQMFPPPDFVVEGDMSEKDILWRKDLRESDAAMTQRLHNLLDEVFHIDQAAEAEYVSLTAHGGAIMAILRAIGHRPFGVAVGGGLPMLLELQKMPGPRPPQDAEPWLPNVDCGEYHEHPDLAN